MSEAGEKKGGLFGVFTRFAGGAGITAGLGYIAIMFKLYGIDKAIVAQAVAAAPLFVIVIFGLVMFNENFRRGIEVFGQYAAEQKRLADAVTTISQRDDQRLREQEITLNHLARQTDEILAELRKTGTGAGG